MIKMVKCLTCRNYIIEDVLYWPKCKAFPKGIPEEILYETADHEKPYPGDNGIRYEPIEGDK